MACACAQKNLRLRTATIFLVHSSIPSCAQKIFFLENFCENLAKNIYFCTKIRSIAPLRVETQWGMVSKTEEITHEQQE